MKMASKIRSIDDLDSIKKLAKINDEFSEFSEDIYNILLESGAILKGHFLLLSGRHSDYYLRFNNLCKFSENVSFIANTLLSQVNFDFDAVISPDTAGIILAHEVAGLRKIKRITASTDEKKMPTDLINHLDLSAGDKVLIVNDMTTTTEGLRKLISLVKKKDAIPVGVVLFATRAESIKPQISQLKSEIPLISMIDLQVQDYEYADSSSCKLCKNIEEYGEPIESWELN